MLKYVLIAIAVLLLFGAVSWLTCDLNARAASRGHNVSTTVSVRGPVTDCSQLKVTFDHDDAVRAEEHLTIPKSAATVLAVTAAHNGGVQVQGWNRSEFAVTACKAAAPSSGRAVLDRIAISVEHGRLSVRGPGDTDEWVAYLLIQAPLDAAMNLEAVNGPIDLYETGGKMQVRTENGPIGLKRCSGDLDVTAQNGPVSVLGSKGNIRVRTENGPITVNLLGDTWESGEFRADAINGPLTVRVPDNYQSGIVIETSNHSPVSCRSGACSQAQRTWDDDHRRLEFGKRTPTLRMSTVNGPVTVESRSADY